MKTEIAITLFQTQNTTVYWRGYVEGRTEAQRYDNAIAACRNHYLSYESFGYETVVVFYKEFEKSWTTTY